MWGLHDKPYLAEDFPRRSAFPTSIVLEIEESAVHKAFSIIEREFWTILV